MISPDQLIQMTSVCTQDDVDAFELAEDYGFDDETMDRLACNIDPEELKVRESIRAYLKQFEQAILLQVDDVLLKTISELAHHPATVATTPLPSTVVYKIDDEVQNGLNKAAKELQNQTVQKLFEPIEIDDGSSLHIERNTSGEAIGAVVTYVTTRGQRHNITTQHTMIKPGNAMPYIRLPDSQRPSVSDSVQLNKLSTEQEFAFRLIMGTMEKHINKEKDIPQLTMSILGNAGELNLNTNEPHTIYNSTRYVKALGSPKSYQLYCGTYFSTMHQNYYW